MPQNFIIELKLDYNKNEKVYLDKVFWHAKNIYNYELNRIENRYNITTNNMQNHKIYLYIS